MWSKILMTALSSLSQKQVPVENMALAVRKELSGSVLKLLVSLTLTTAIIFSMIQSGSALRSLVGTLENGALLQFLLFGILTIIGLGMLFFMFRQKPRAISEPAASAPSLEALLMTFIQGFLDGLNTERASDSKKNRSQDLHP